MDFKEIKQIVSMDRLFQHYGLSTDSKRRCACPLHNGGNPQGFSIASDAQSWKCFSGDCGGGDIFNFVEKKENCSNSEARLKIEEFFNLASGERAKTRVTPRVVGQKPIKSRREYQYRDKDGKHVFSTLRIQFEDGTKTFRQKCGDRWSLPDSVRTIYNLDKIHSSGDEIVFLVEGEKAADAIESCGFIGTTNPMGCGNWDEKYAALLKDRDVVIMPDADDQGEKWRDSIHKTLVGIVKSLRFVNVPDAFISENPQFKGHDVADMVEIQGAETVSQWIRDQLESVEVLPRGIDPQILGRPADIWERIERNARLGVDTTVFDFAEWIPSMPIRVKRGDLVVLMANTSTGKSRLLHNIPYHISRLNYAIFDLELSQETLALRYAAMENRVSMDAVERMLLERRTLRPVTVENVYIQKIPNVTVDLIAERVELLEKVTGREIHCVGIDYIGLMGGPGSAYERTSNNVEAFKAYCGQTGKVGLMTTQVARPEDRERGMYRCPSPFHAKNSGSMENSAQLLIGYWKDENDPMVLNSRIMKYSHGSYPTEDIKLRANDLLITDLSRPETPVNATPRTRHFEV